MEITDFGIRDWDFGSEFTRGGTKIASLSSILPSKQCDRFGTTDILDCYGIQSLMKINSCQFGTRSEMEFAGVFFYNFPIFSTLQFLSSFGTGGATVWTKG